MLCSRCGHRHGTPEPGEYLHDGRRLVEVVAVTPRGTSALLRNSSTLEEFSIGTCLVARDFVSVREKVPA